MFSYYHNMITWTYLKAWCKHDTEVHFEQHEVPAVFHKEKLRILFLRHFFYIRLLEDPYRYKEKKLTQNNVQSLVKLDLKVAYSLWLYSYELKTSGKFPLRYVVMLCYFVYIKWWTFNIFILSFLTDGGGETGENSEGEVIIVGG